MDFINYQKEARITKNSFNTIEMNLLEGALGISSESGEVTDLVKKYLFQQHDFDKKKIELELGDVLWYISLICDAIDTTLEDVAISNILKLRKRFKDKFTAEESIRRIDINEGLFE